MKLITGLISSVALLFSSAAYAQDLTDMSFEELLASDITSVAKRPQKAEEAAAAVAVLSQDDIRKTGATTLPELLRFVPGVEVAEIDANNAAVGARGFNWRFSNKLLVLIDGRSVYQSVLSGVLWDEQLVPVEDIDRIEVIRGPGATLYGANAVNGVINVVTKHAADTLGGLVTTQAGVTTTTEQFTGRFFGRQGMRLGDRGAMRLYVTGRDTPSLIDLDEQPINDGSRGIQTGFRLDWEPNEQDAFTLQGDYRTVDFDVSLLFTLPVGPDGVQTFETRDENEAVNLVGRWSRSFDTDSKLTVQAFYDSGSRTEFGSNFNYETVDLDISHYFSWGDQFETLWGIGYRSIEDEVRGSDLFAFQEPRLRTDLFSGFVQQDVNLVGDRLRVSLGSKFEHNDFTGFEVQPSVRAIWLGNDWSVWGAVSRAVRTPSRFETSLEFEFGIVPPDPAAGIFLPVETKLVGTPNLQAEDLLSFELGWRKSFSDNLSFDFSAYFNDYSDLVILALDTPQIITAPSGPGNTAVPVLIDQDIIIRNGREGQVYGLEGSIKWRVADWWNLSAFGEVKDFNFEDIGFDSTGLFQSFQGLSPNYQATIRSDFSFSPDLMATLTTRRVGQLVGSETDGYTDVDLRLLYRVSRQVELGILAENLVEASRQEFTSTLYPAPFGAVERRVSASVGFRF